LPETHGVAGAGESSVPPTDSTHQLDAKNLTDSFARIGIVCSILRPGAEETGFDKVIFAVTAGSNVVILDWVLHEFKQGEKTVEIIKELLKSSGADRGRARLIIIYTGENDLDQIATSVRTALKLPEGEGSDDPFTIERGAARICIYAKEQSRLSANTRKRKVEIAELPGVVIGKFAKMTRGLVSNVALRSLAALRANTYQLLRRFHRRLDPPYATHSTLLLPEDASDHLVPLIVSEIQAVLEDAKVSDLASLKRVGQWLRHQIDGGLTFALPQQTTEKEFRQGLADLLKHGLNEESLSLLFRDHPKFSQGFLKSKKKALEVVRDQLTGTITLERDKGTVKDHDLALLMSVRSRYSSPPPRLSLGSIVVETRRHRSQFLLCVQPRCDSVRLKSERPFPFLPMKQVNDNEPCDFIIEERGRTTRLRLSDKPSDARMIKFVPGSEKQVLARRAKSGRFFKASGTTSRYRWVADLKPEHAQRVANDYAYKLSRVGLTESEWLRRWTPGLAD
jgi:hypothetical protein